MSIVPTLTLTAEQLYSAIITDPAASAKLKSTMKLVKNLVI